MKDFQPTAEDFFAFAGIVITMLMLCGLAIMFGY